MWVAEGLLMYLEEDAVRSLLEEAAGVHSCPLVLGSCTLPSPRCVAQGNSNSHQARTWIPGLGGDANPQHRCLLRDT